MVDLTASKIRSMLDYDPATGDFSWLSGRLRGRKAGCITKDGYWVITIARRPYYAHRLVWLHVNGEWPADQIDHRDGDKCNNRIENLRIASASQNAQNRVVHRNNKSGYLGVTKRGDTYIAQIMAEGEHVILGYRSDPSDAHQLYLAAKARMHGFQPTPRDC